MATCRASGRASVLIRMISACTSAGWPASCSVRAVLRHHLRVVLESGRDLLLLCRVEHGAVLRHLREGEGQGGEHDRAGERQPEREPERAGCRVDAGGLADPVLGDRREGVVVQLGDQQPQPDPAITSGTSQVPAGRRPGDDRQQHDHARAGAGSPTG